MTALLLAEDLATAEPVFPETRYMGSKRKLVPFILRSAALTPYRSVLDAFSGSGVVSHAFKAAGKRVITNDFMRFNHLAALAMVENEEVRLTDAEAARICSPHPSPGTFIQDTFAGLYFTDEENAWLDSAVSHILELPTPLERAIAFTALCRACVRKRARGLFTYVGMRYDDGRRDLKRTFADQFRRAVSEVNGAVFRGAQPAQAFGEDVFSWAFPAVDLVYLDPPYVSVHSDNEYQRRYHFLEGLVSYWSDLPVQAHTKTKKLAKRPSLFDSRRTVDEAFRHVFTACGNAAILVSYSSNCIPAREDLVSLLAATGRRVQVFEQDHTYTFSSHQSDNGRNRVQEYLFLAT